MILAHQQQQQVSRNSTNTHPSTSPPTSALQRTTINENDAALMIQPYSQQPLTNISPDYYFTPPPPTTTTPFDPTILMNDFSRSHQHQRAASSTYPHTAASSTDRFLSPTLQPIYNNNNNPTMRCSAATAAAASTCSSQSVSSPFAFDTAHSSVLAPQPQPTHMPSIPFADEIATQSKHLRFHVVLQAATAITQKSEETSITYMNRGQSYAIQLNDRHKHDGPITSTVAITFHDPSHRRVANNYWKFWLSQQKTPQAARAIDIDNAQSTGISNIQYPGFDRISFEWNGACGARIHVRFNCLSTDFSRIKGVKGIPLRAQMESRALPSSSASSPASLEQQQQQQQQQPSSWEYNESSFCKIKLFRDKGAERKNKDDIKQAGKQFEKMRETAGDDLGRHPMWLMYNQPMPYSVFTETPTSPVLEHHPPTSFDFHFNSKHARTITAPSILPSYHYHLDTWFQSSSPVTAAADTPLTATATGPVNALIDMGGKRWSETDDGYFTAKTPDYSTTTPGSINSNGSVTLPSSNTNHNDDLMTRPFMVTPALSFMSTPSPVTPSGITATAPSTKRPLPQDDTTTSNNNNNNKRRNVEALCLYIQVAATQQRIPNAEPKRLQLEKPTVDDLKHKLCTLLSLHPNQVADVIWRRKDDTPTPPTTTTAAAAAAIVPTSQQPSTHHTKRSNNSNNNDVLILVDDSVVAQHLLDNAMVTVSWEIKADGMVRLVLEH